MGIACQIEPVQGIVKAKFVSLIVLIHIIAIIYLFLLMRFFSDWLVLVCMISSIGVLVALHIKRKETPTNFILLTIFVSIPFNIPGNSSFNAFKY